MQAREPLPHLQSQLEKNMKRSVNHVGSAVVILSQVQMDDLQATGCLVTTTPTKSHIAGGMATKKHSQKQDIGCE